MAGRTGLYRERSEEKKHLCLFGDNTAVDIYIALLNYGRIISRICSEKKSHVACTPRCSGSNVLTSLIQEVCYGRRQKTTRKILEVM